MKKILFAIATLAVLVSCQKVELAEQNSVNTNGERVITAYFDNAQTKTALDENGITPKWEPNDKIMLLDGTNKQEITLEESNISSDGKSVTFTTSLEGTIYAVYPSTATSAEKIENGNIVPVTLSGENQDGTFGCANICVAKDNDGSLAFKNVTSVLHLTQTAATTKVNEIIITTPSANIAGTGTVDMSATTPALTLSSEQSKKIKVKSASAKSDYYIAVAPATLPAGTAFGFATGSELGGTNLSTSKEIAANTIYNIGSMDALEIEPNTYHEYVEINGLKWATMNIGAASATEAGTYFEWGNTTGHALKESSVGETGNIATAFVSDYNFSWANCPYQMISTSSAGSTKFTKYLGSTTSSYKHATATDADAMKTVLDLVDDAAYVNWGGAWRMPTKAEFDALKSLRKGTFASGYHFGGDAAEAQIFLPAAGYGNGTGLDGAGDYGYYWSSSLFTANPSRAYFFYFYDGDAFTNNHYRCNGYSVRPVSD